MAKTEEKKVDAKTFTLEEFLLLVGASRPETYHYLRTFDNQKKQSKEDWSKETGLDLKN